MSFHVSSNAAGCLPNNNVCRTYTFASQLARERAKRMCRKRKHQTTKFNKSKRKRERARKIVHKLMANIENIY